MTRHHVLALLALAACASPQPAPPPAPAQPAPAAATPAPTVDTGAARQAVAAAAAAPAPVVARRVPRHAIVPAPASVAWGDSLEYFTLDSLTTTVTVDSGSGPEVRRLAGIVTRWIGRDTLPKVLQVRAAALAGTDTNTIHLRLDSAVVGDEAYAVEVTRRRIAVRARTTEGLFRGIQTVRQLFPPVIEHRYALIRRLRAPAVRIEDAPRFAWRGSMLDVSRHFLPVEDVKRHIDLMSVYKLNRLHLHLSDDQGWRLEIRKHPRLTSVGGRTAVGGGPGGFYTQAQFREIVRYARERYVMIIPEFDMPGHTNAALTSIARLNCDGKAPPAYTGIRVGFSAICHTKPSTYRWIDDIVREVAAISPSPYLHMGGDEVSKIPHAEYLKFMERVDSIVRRHGKRMVAWGEASTGNLDTSATVQAWRGNGRDSVQVHAARGGKVIMSPGHRMYIDMKPDSSNLLGLRWAGVVPLRATYDWDPATYQAGVPEAAILGVEAPLWSETLVTYRDFEFLAFPRLLSVAEVGWTPQQGRDYDDFRARLAQQGRRLQALGVNFYRSPDVEWVP